MFGKFMNNFYYGKSGKGDFRKEDLPETRWQLFWATLRVRFSGLVRLNLMYMLCWLPAIIVICMGMMSLYNALVDPDTMIAATGMNVAEFAQGLLGQTLLLLIPCILITGPFTAGISYVTRNWARDEHAFVWSDFKDAVKANWKQALIISAITSVVPILMYLCWSFYGQMVRTNGMFFLVPQVIAVSVAVLWLMSLMYLYPMLVTYDKKLGQLNKNGQLLTIGRLPQTAGIKLLTVLPVAIAAVVSYYTPYFIYAMLVAIGYYAILGFSLSRFVQASYSNAVFDRYINTRIEGAEVDRGLYKDPDADDDESDEGAANADPADDDANPKG